MTIILNSLDDMTRLDRYKALRDSAKNYLENGVYPNGAAALDAYTRLLLALSGGDEFIENLSEYASFHALTLSQVSPFVAAIQAAIQVSNDTMQIINMLSASTQPTEPLPFNIPSKAVTIPDYLTTLATAIATLQATQAAMQQAAQSLQGGE